MRENKKEEEIGGEEMEKTRYRRKTKEEVEEKGVKKEQRQTEKEEAQ